ncbi:MAG: TIGR01777 family protein [Aquimarina sp.]|nr:TIGR01777 family protein [Aquimarina sp.]
MDKIVIAGGSGFLGKVLSNYFVNQGAKVSILTRNKNLQSNNPGYILWDGKNLGKWTSVLESCDALINLCGRSVDCRYTDKNKSMILQSRIQSTEILGKAILNCKKPPKVWLNSSTATIYKHSEQTPMTESSGVLGDNFSENIAKAWENSFFSFETPFTRKVALRTSIVLGKEGGAFLPLKKLAQLGLGGKQGNGKQMISWIHELDFCKSIDYIIQNPNLSGAVNVVSPYAINNNTFMRHLRKSQNMPFGIPLSKKLLEIGARFIQTETELILKSRFVYPEVLLEKGFEFEFPNIKKALQNL